MRVVWALGAAIVWATPAAAADKPAIGPAPSWVKPRALPAVSAKSDEAAIRLLLHDQQVAFERGRQTTYQQVVMRLQTPQGLAAGSISFPWRPDTDTLTVHKLHIRRGAQIIDVLASGQTFTVVRRETNLENAMLDGVLTANIQPEGLQVGDIIDFAASIATSDPTFKGHVEQLGAAWNVAPIGQAHMRMQWPSALPVRWRQSGGLPTIKPVKAGDTSSIEVAMTDAEPLNLPKGAPARFQIGRLVEASDFSSWAELAALMDPLYKQASVLPASGPLATEAARIKAFSSDPRVRAQAALALVQDRVRYVALAMGAGGLVPSSAEETWARRFGDCKGKTALLLSLLHAFGIEAEPVLVSTVFGDGMDERLPMVGLFNHVLVRATIGGRTYWLDGTRTGDMRLDAIRVPPFGWGLPVRAAGATLVRMLPPPLDAPTQEISIRIDATAGLKAPAPTRVEMLTRGDEALGMKMGLANMTPDARDRALRDYWKAQYDFIDVKTVTAAFDPARGEHRLVMEGEARMDWSSGHYETDGTSIGYKADFRRDPGPDSDAPFAVAYPVYTRTVETILLPKGGGGFKTGVGAEVDRTVAGVAYRRKATLEGNVFTVEKSERSLVPEFAARDAPAAQAALRELAETMAYVQAPTRYTPTDKDVDAAMATTPATAGALIRRGNVLLDLGRMDDAIVDFDRAVALEPGNALALAHRGIARAWKGDAAAANTDLDAAFAIDPRNAVIFRARGMLAQKGSDHASAVEAFTTALEIDPSSWFALGRRAQSYRALGDNDRALADSAAALRFNPKNVDLRLMRVNLLRSLGRDGEALAEAGAISIADPDNAYAQVAAARIYAAYKRPTEAMKAFDRAIALEPEAYIYLNRSEVRPSEDVAGRRADLDAAFRLDPDGPDILEARAKFLEETGDRPGAIRAWSAAIAAVPEDPGMLLARGLAYAKAGDAVLAEKDFAAARTLADEPSELNDMCWDKATAGIALQSALADCDAALSKSPDRANFLDSRGLVLLRLGRLDEAIATYDRAIAKQPGLSSSLYGRAVAWARKGDRTKAAADAAAAIKADTDVKENFERYGVKL